jgi:PKD repeat protein
VIFSDASTGSITNWRWNFGDGHLFTNTVSGTATNTYAANGNYTVSLTVSGVNGTNTSTLTNYIVVASATPTAAFYAMATNGFVPLTVVFTNTSTGTITNWVWNLGNGANLTNSTGANVTNTYAAAGVYPVSLIARGPGGANTNILANYIVTSPTPKLGGLTQVGGKLVFSGTNGPVGVQYRVLTSTNLATWTPVLTNKIPANGIYVYTNSWPTNPAAFFKLVSP